MALRVICFLMILLSYYNYNRNNNPPSLYTPPSPFFDSGGKIFEQKRSFSFSKNVAGIFLKKHAESSLIFCFLVSKNKLKTKVVIFAGYIESFLDERFFLRQHLFKIIYLHLIISQKGWKSQSCDYFFRRNNKIIRWLTQTIFQKYSFFEVPFF